MTSADCKTNGNCMRPEPKSSPTVFMPGHERAVDYVERRRAQPERLFQLGLEAIARPVYHALFEALVNRPIAAVLFCQALRYGPFEKAQQFSQWVISPRSVTTVIDQVEANIDRFGGQPVERHYPPGVDDGGVEAGFLAFVQENRVEGLAGRRGQAERNVGDPEHGPHTGVRRLDELYALYRFDTVAAAFFHPRAYGQYQGVEKEVFGKKAITVDSQVVYGAGRPHFPFRRPRLALGVDAGAYDGRAVVTGQPEETVEAGAFGVTFLEVD